MLYIYFYIIYGHQTWKRGSIVFVHTTQLTFICSKSAIETLEKGVNDVVLVFLLLTLNTFHTSFQVFLLLTLNK